MKKIFTILSTLVLATACYGQFRSQQFMAPGITSVTVSNAAAAPFGGFTNVNSFANLGYEYINGVAAIGNGGTNSWNLSWTNSSGVWVRPTNNTPQSVAGVYNGVTNDATALFLDVTLPLDRNGQLLSTVVSNDGATFISPYTLTIKSYGDTAAAGTLNLIFTGVSDGTNEDYTTALPAVTVFQWGVSNQPGIYIWRTNFPMYKFAGCQKLRLRSAAITTTTAASIGDTILSLSLNGPVP